MEFCARQQTSPFLNIPFRVVEQFKYLDNRGMANNFEMSDLIDMKVEYTVNINESKEVLIEERRFNRDGVFDEIIEKDSVYVIRHQNFLLFT
jgi:hypothetical protein